MPCTRSGTSGEGGSPGPPVAGRPTTKVGAGPCGPAPGFPTREARAKRTLIAVWRPRAAHSPSRSSQSPQRCRAGRRPAPRVPVRGPAPDLLPDVLHDLVPTGRAAQPLGPFGPPRTPDDPERVSRSGFRILHGAGRAWSARGERRWRGRAPRRRGPVRRAAVSERGFVFSSVPTSSWRSHGTGSAPGGGSPPRAGKDPGRDGWEEIGFSSRRPISEAGLRPGCPSDDVLDQERRHSAARLSQKDPWLCVPASRPVCLCRVIVGSAEPYRGNRKGQIGAQKPSAPGAKSLWMCRLRRPEIDSRGLPPPAFPALRGSRRHEGIRGGGSPPACPPRGPLEDDGSPDRTRKV